MYWIARGLAMAAVLLVIATPARAELSPLDRAAYEAAFAAVEEENWEEAHRQAARATERLPAEVIAWLDYQRPETEASFDTIAAFLDAHPTWPARNTLRRQAEATALLGADAAFARDWFRRNPPLTGDGALAYLLALDAAGDTASVDVVAPPAWRNLDFTGPAERQFYQRYRKRLSAADHRARTDRLLAGGNVLAARRMARRVSKGEADLIVAKLTLMQVQPGVDPAIARVPRALRDDPGLWFERMRWRRRKGFDEAAREILLDPPIPLPRTNAWTNERMILARRAHADGHFSDAYKLAAGHGLVRGARFAAAEFYAGWIMLTTLQDGLQAYRHFNRLYDSVSFPISRARAAYWAGRAATHNGFHALAALWYERAAEHPTTFYGQRALAALGRPLPILVEALPARSPDEANFASQELVQVVEMLVDLGVPEHSGNFLARLALDARSSGELLRIAELAQSAGRPSETIFAAKRAALQGANLVRFAFPVPPLALPATAPDGRARPDDALTLALIRQESSFDPEALSPAGARGLMQIMPGTARRTAQAIGIKYTRDRLTEDPEYNLRLGTAYLSEQLTDYGDSAVLALAAYNAGPGNLQRWLRTYGDPRTAEVDIIDWIESIPFEETRNYVQRVMEAVPVYRHLLTDGGQIATTLPALQ